MDSLASDDQICMLGTEISPIKEPRYSLTRTVGWGDMGLSEICGGGNLAWEDFQPLRVLRNGSRDDATLLTAFGQRIALVQEIFVARIAREKVANAEIRCRRLSLLATRCRLGAFFRRRNNSGRIRTPSCSHYRLSDFRGIR